MFKEGINSLLVYSSELDIDVLSYLYGKGYSVDEIVVYVAPNTLFKAFICTSEYINDDDEVRRSAIELQNDNIISECLINYNNYGVVRLRKDGYEEQTICKVYETDTTYPIYIKDNISYSYPTSDRYIPITNKDQLRIGMLVELYSNGEWLEKFVDNLTVDYDNIYSLFIKHNKIRTKANY